jgi:hypothetical protein
MVHTVTREERLRPCSPGATHRGERHHAIRNGKEDKGVVYSGQNDWSYYVFVCKTFGAASRVRYVFYRIVLNKMSSHQE